MTRQSRPLLAGTLALIVIVAGCTSGGAPTGSGPSSAGPTAPAPTAVPVPSSPAAPRGTSGGGSGPDPGTGIVPIEPGGGDGSGGVPPQPRPTLVTPMAGLLDVHQVGATALQTSVDGSRLSVTVAWWSGVEPCNVLAGVDVTRDGDKVTLTVREGASRLGVACIEIAVYKATIVDLGELDPGTYTIAAFGNAPPVQVSIPG